MKQQKKYSLNEILKQGLLLKPDGTPFRSINAIQKRVQSFGFTANRVDGRGMMIYGISAEDLKKMNNQ